MIFSWSSAHEGIKYITNHQPLDLLRESFLFSFCTELDGFFKAPKIRLETGLVLIFLDFLAEVSVCSMIFTSIVPMLD